MIVVFLAFFLVVSDCKAIDKRIFFEIVCVPSFAYALYLNARDILNQCEEGRFFRYAEQAKLFFKTYCFLANMWILIALLGIE